jgi:hypothetical protein
MKIFLYQNLFYFIFWPKKKAHRDILFFELLVPLLIIPRLHVNLQFSDHLFSNHRDRDKQLTHFSNDEIYRGSKTRVK